MAHYQSGLEMNTDELDESVWVLTACHTELDPVKEAEFVCPLQIFEQFSVVDFCVFFRVMWECDNYSGPWALKLLFSLPNFGSP